jgi:DNA-binding response OmpR family regulator
MPETKNVLVISNEYLLYEKLQKQLIEYGYNLKYCCSYDPSLRRIIEEFNPNIMVIDPEIPDMKGLKLSLLIRQWSPAPILLVCPALSGPQEIRILDVTSKDWLSEPLGVDLVAVRVHSLI